MWQNGEIAEWISGTSSCTPYSPQKHVILMGTYASEVGSRTRWASEEYLHCPWDADHGLLAKLGIVLGEMPRGCSNDNQRLKGCTYPGRIIKDLEYARRVSHEAVMSVRRSTEGARRVLERSGHEWLPLEGSNVGGGGSRRAVLITRIDYREGKITTRQTGDEFRDFRKRAPCAGNLFGMAMQIDMKNSSGSAGDVDDDEESSL